MEAVRDIVQKEGVVRGCLKGIQPRIIKKPMSNTLCMMLYEVIFRTFEDSRAF